MLKYNDVANIEKGNKNRTSAYVTFSYDTILYDEPCVW